MTAAPAPSPKPRTILVIDDDEGMRLMLRRILEKEAYQVAEATDGEEGLAACQRVNPDLILLDGMMPRMSGFEVVKHLREDDATRAVPVLMLTALPDMNDKVRGLDLGADDFLRKPINRVELLARVRSLLRIRQLHAELEQKNALLHNVLNRYVAEDVANEILENPAEKMQLGGHTSRVSVLFADIRGFTGFTEDHPAPVVVSLINHVFNKLVPVIFAHKGTFDKYLGDAVMAFYGAPVSYPDDTLRAVLTAAEMQKVFEALKHEQPELQALGLGIGIFTGDAVVGNLGSEQVMDYTVIGDVPNSAKRLQENAGPGQILICPTTCEAVQDRVKVRPLEPLLLKGKKAPLQVFEVLGLRE
jgi:class 3 adenylate cyclase